MMRIIKGAGNRGFVLMTMGLAAVALFGALGLAVDVGRVFIAKNETQAYCDAAALAATLRLDGTTGGIQAAQAAVSNTRDAWNMDTTTITNSQVDFATNPNGPWNSNPTPATGYTVSRVQVTVSAQLYFVPVIANQFAQNVLSMAVAQQVPLTSITRGLAPYTVVSTNTDPTQAFGLIQGNQYDIQWPNYNGTRNGCSPLTPDQCFVSPPCTGDPTASQAAVSQYWGASLSGYWGSNANSVIDAEVLDDLQTQTITIGQPIFLTSGNKNAEAQALDTRVNEDLDTQHNSVPDYLNNPQHNGRRLIALPVVNPTASGTDVLGFASFLLLSNGPNSNFYEKGTGNNPYCAVFVGAYVQGSTSEGGSASGAGAFKVLLVQ